MVRKSHIVNFNVAGHTGMLDLLPPDPGFRKHIITAAKECVVRANNGSEGTRDASVRERIESAAPKERLRYRIRSSSEPVVCSIP